MSNLDNEVNIINKLKESDLYQPVKEWLEKAGYEVYAEVCPFEFSTRADVVGYNHPVACIIEMKTSLTFDLIEQVLNWREVAHYAYIAIPKRKRRVSNFVYNLLSEKGVGILEVSDGYQGVHQTLKAKFNRAPMKRYGKNFDWRKELLPEHQTWLDGGSSGGGYVTPYALTIDRIKKLLKQAREGQLAEYNYKLRKRISLYPEGWMSVADILEYVETHYSSPKPSVAKALTSFETDWCESKKENRKLWFRCKIEER